MARSLVAIGVMLALASGATAAPAFDPASGQGFAGRGDVQTAFGWTATAFLASAAGVTFTFDGTDSYSATCTVPGASPGRAGPGQTIVVGRHGRVGSTVHRDARGHADGFNLIGYDSVATEQPAPRQGDTCAVDDLGVRRSGVWTMVSPTNSAGRLFASFAGASAAIWP